MKTYIYINGNPLNSNLFHQLHYGWNRQQTWTANAYQSSKRVTPRPAQQDRQQPTRLQRHLLHPSGRNFFASFLMRQHLCSLDASRPGETLDLSWQASLTPPTLQKQPAFSNPPSSYWMAFSYLRASSKAPPFPPSAQKMNPKPTAGASCS